MCKSNKSEKRSSQENKTFKLWELSPLKNYLMEGEEINYNAEFRQWYFSGSSKNILCDLNAFHFTSSLFTEIKPKPKPRKLYAYKDPHGSAITFSTENMEGAFYGSYREDEYDIEFPIKDNK